MTRCILIYLVGLISKMKTYLHCLSVTSLAYMKYCLEHVEARNNQMVKKISSPQKVYKHE